MSVSQICLFAKNFLWATQAQRGKSQSSRHTSAIKYFLWIKVNHDNLQDPVVGWYCECKAGARTVGCCAHIATIIMYQNASYKPKSGTFSTTVRDAAVVQTDSEMVYLTCLFFWLTWDNEI